MSAPVHVGIIARGCLSRCILGYMPGGGRCLPQYMLEYLPGGCLPQCMLGYLPGVSAPVHAGIPALGMSAPLHAGIPARGSAQCMLGYNPPPPWTEFLTHACQNITFPQLLLRTVIIYIYLQAVCCNDKIHCCPNGYKCNTKEGTCSKGHTSIPWFEKVAGRNPHTLDSSRRLENERKIICPDQTSQCPDNNTCCKLESGEYGCCPLPHVRLTIY